MSILSTLVNNLQEPAAPTGSLLADSIFNTQPPSGYVETGKVYLQSEYPALYSTIGLVNTSPWTVEKTDGGGLQYYSTRPASLVYNNNIWVVSDGHGYGYVRVSLNNGASWFSTAGAGSPNSLTFGNSRWVSVGNSGAVRTTSTTTALTTTGWSAFTLGTATLTYVTYTNATWVVLNEKGTLQYTTTAGAINNSGYWNDASNSPTTSTAFNCIIFSSGVWVLVGDTYGGTGNALIRINSTITQFRTGLNSTSSTLNKIAKHTNNSTMVAVGNGGTIVTSTNISFWTTRTSGTTATFSAIHYANGLWLAGGVGGNLRSSTDAITWTTRTSGTTSNISSIFYGAGLWLLSAGTLGALRSSTDGITWTTRTSGTSSEIITLHYDNSLWVAGLRSLTATNILTSTNGITWTARGTGSGQAVECLQYAQNIWLAAGTNGTLRSSTDAITWTTRTSGTGNLIRSIVYSSADQYWVAGASSGNVVISKDAITWTRRDYSSVNTTGLVYNTELNAIAGVAGNSIFYTRDLGLIYRSVPDIPTTNNIRTITYNGIDTWAIGGDNGYLATSTDLFNWKLHTSYTSNTITSIKYENNRWTYVISASPHIGTSTNGSTWTLVKTSYPEYDNAGTNIKENILGITYANNKWYSLTYVSSESSIKILSSADYLINKAYNYNTATEFYVPKYTLNISNNNLRENRVWIKT